jgi:Zn-dependent peptidase ImmA (M78 family)
MKHPIRLSYPEKVAYRVIQSYEIKAPPVNVEEFAVLEGLTVVRMDSWNSLHGMLFRETKRIGINSKDHPNRQRFSLAHELGHYFLNHFQDRLDANLGMECADDEKDTRDQEANVFAAELLMPHDLLGNDFSRLRDAKKLASLYLVSEEAMWRRVLRLKLI